MLKIFSKFKTGKPIATSFGVLVHVLIIYTSFLMFIYTLSDLLPLVKQKLLSTRSLFKTCEINQSFSVVVLVIVSGCWWVFFFCLFDLYVWVCFVLSCFIFFKFILFLAICQFRNYNIYPFFWQWIFKQDLTF